MNIYICTVLHLYTNKLLLDNTKWIICTILTLDLPHNYYDRKLNTINRIFIIFWYCFFQFHHYQQQKSKFWSAELYSQQVHSNNLFEIFNSHMWFISAFNSHACFCLKRIYLEYWTLWVSPKQKHSEHYLITNSLRLICDLWYFLNLYLY